MYIKPTKVEGLLCIPRAGMEPKACAYSHKRRSHIFFYILDTSYIEKNRNTLVIPIEVHIKPMSVKSVMSVVEPQ